MLVFPNCKINLGLNILSKREDGYHNIETIFYPLPLQDVLEIITASSSNTDIEFTMSGNEIAGDVNDNICVKAYYLLKKYFPELPSVKMHLHKVIPSGAGLGGGSGDGAFALILLNKKYNLGLTKEKLIKYALRLGSDCPFFIINKPCYATGRGERLEEIKLDLSAYKIIIVNPGIHINTAWAFSQVSDGLEPSDTNTPKNTLNPSNLTTWKNDFEPIVFNQYPEIKNIKEQLYTAGAKYTSMSGTGSTVYGLFDKNTAVNFNFPDSYYIKTIQL